MMTAASCEVLQATVGEDFHAPEEREKRFVETVEQFRRIYFRWVLRRTRSYQEAEDIVQTAFLQAYLNLHRFRGEARMSSWLWTIVRNTTFNYGRECKAKPVLSLEFGEDEEENGMIRDFPDGAPSPQECCERREMLDMLHEAISCLRSTSREVIDACVLGELSHKSAALKLQLTTPTVKSRVFKAKRELAAAMNARVTGNAEGNFPSAVQ